jgi:predicted secreted protein with PEFG-CTERM motif
VGLCIVILNLGSDFLQNYMVFAQTNGTYQGPIPEDNSTADNNPADIGTGPIPEDNSTNMSSPENSTDINPNDTNNSPDTTVPNVSSDLGNSFDNTTSNGTSQVNGTGGNTVPEFGSVSSIVLAVAILSIIILSVKTRFLK